MGDGGSRLARSPDYRTRLSRTAPGHPVGSDPAPMPGKPFENGVFGTVAKPETTTAAFRQPSFETRIRSVRRVVPPRITSARYFWA